MRRAGRLITYSEYSLSEIARNTPIPPDRVTVVHLGVPDPFGEVGPRQGAPGAHGRRDRPRHARPEGAAAVRAGGARAARRALRVRRASGSTTRSTSCARSRPTNVEFTGWLSDDDLRDALPARRRLRAGLPPRGLRPGGGRGDAGRLRAGGGERDGDARGGRRRGRADRIASGPRRWPRASAGRSSWGRTRVALHASVFSRPSRWRVGGTGSCEWWTRRWPGVVSARRCGGGCASSCRLREALLLDLGRARLRAAPPGQAGAGAAPGRRRRS